MTQLRTIYEDGAYDSKARHQLIACKSIASHKDAELWEKEHARNEEVLADGLTNWKEMSGYHHRSLADTAMSRFKQLMMEKSVFEMTTARWGK